MNTLQELLTKAKKETDRVQAISLFNEALSLDWYEALKDLFTVRGLMNPSWFNTFKGIRMEELQIEEMAADAWLEKKVEEENPDAMYVRYLMAIYEMKLIMFMAQFKEEQEVYKNKIPENQAVAKAMIEGCAKAGIRSMKLELARQYRVGEFFPVDYQKSMDLCKELYEEEADNDLLYQIGLLYFGGPGVEQDLKMAADYLTRSGMDKGLLKIANGPSLSEICQNYILRCEIKRVTGTRLLGGSKLHALIAENDLSSITFHEYSKTPDIVMVPLTEEILSVQPYGYDLSEKLFVDGQYILKRPLNLERLDSVENVVLDNFDKICLHMVKKEDICD